MSAPPPIQPPAFPNIRPAPKKTPTLLIIMGVLVGLGVFFWGLDWADKSGKAQAERSVAILAEGFARTHAVDVRQAIIERRVIRGMTPHQVIQSRGTNGSQLTGGQITDEQRRAGVVEIWMYDQDTHWYVVCFGHNGLVLDAYRNPPLVPFSP